MTDFSADKLRALHKAANRIADNGNHLAIKVSGGCFDYCSGGCDCAEESKRIKATADSDAVEFHRLISAILAMAEREKRMRDALEPFAKAADELEAGYSRPLPDAFMPHASIPLSAYRVARDVRSLGEEKT